mmetsp:Transcript_1802/g.2904  ORF Transcript_1802/g.2904 Transcript_1802/m.2904 type:complete len:230 (-) Transcript_1802:2174-2863(-)
MLSDKLKAWLFIGGCVVGLLVFTLVPQAKSALSEVFTKAKHLGPWGKLIFIAVFGGCIVIGVPLTMLNITLGLFYPFKSAYLISVAGGVIGQSASYFLGRTCLKNYCQELLSSYSQKLQGVLVQHQWKSVCLMNLISMPLVVRNYLLASLGVNFLPFLCIGTLNVLYLSALHIYLSSKTKDLVHDAREGDFVNFEMLFAVSSIIVSVCAFFGLSKLLQNELKKEGYEKI